MSNDEYWDYKPSETRWVLITCSWHGHDLSKLAKVAIVTVDKILQVQYLFKPADEPRMNKVNLNGKQLEPFTENLFEHPYQCGTCKRVRWFRDSALAAQIDTLNQDRRKSVDLDELAATIRSRRTT